MSIKGKSLAVLTPMYGGVLMQNFNSSLMGLHEAIIRMKYDPKILGGPTVDIPFRLVGYYNESLVTRARNRCVDDFLKNGDHTHACFIDADIGFEPVDIFAMLEMDLDIVGAPCPKKTIRWDKVQAAVKRANGRVFTLDELARVGSECVYNYAHYEGKKQINLGEPQEVESIGTGLVMIKREVFLKYKEAYPDRWYEPRGDSGALPGQVHDFFRVGINEETHDYDSEDYCFCKDCRAIGFKIWVCPWMRTSHMGSYKFTGDLPAEAALVGELMR